MLRSIFSLNDKGVTKIQVWYWPQLGTISMERCSTEPHHHWSQLFNSNPKPEKMVFMLKLISGDHSFTWRMKCVLKTQITKWNPKFKGGGGGAKFTPKFTMEQPYMLPILCWQYHACWCTGNFRSQGISRHGINPKAGIFCLQHEKS